MKLISFLLMVCTLAARYIGRDTLSANQGLNPDESIKSSSGQYELVMQHDGNLVFYDHWQNGAPSRVEWASNTVGNNGAYLRAQGDGNLVLYASNGRVLWATNTAGKSECLLWLRNERALSYVCKFQSRWCVGGGCDGLLSTCRNVGCAAKCLGVTASDIPRCLGSCASYCERCGEPHCRP
jgi:hypothetical protein